MAGEMARLEEIVTLATREMRPDASARAPLDRVADRRVRPGMRGAARRLDELSTAIVRAQCLVDHESRASAILFLDAAGRDRWRSYGEYRRSWDDYAAACASRR